MSNPNSTTTRYVIRADLPCGEHLPREVVYWRDGRGWATRPLATVYTSLDDVNAALDHGVPVADLRYCKVRTLRPKAAPPVEATTAESEALPRLFLMAFSKCGDTIFASTRVPPGLDVRVGDRVVVGGHTMTAMEINGTLAQCVGTTLPAPTARVDVSGGHHGL